MQPAISWHYPRTDIAETILDLFDSGSSHAVTLFAPRRMGKTEMLIEDLWPLAEKRGYEVRYASFWLDKASPENVFFDAISGKKQQPASMKARIGVGGSFIEASSARKHNDPSTQPIQAIAAEFRKLTKQRKRVLLLLDEIQELASGKENDDFVAMLRTLLDTQKKKVHVVFTGSSQERLLKMFHRQKAPLFNFSHQLDLPEMGSPFVKHMLDAFHQASGKTLNLSASLRVFTKAHHVPARFHDLLRAMLIDGTYNIERAFEHYQQSSGEQQRFGTTWQQTKPLDQQVLKAIAARNEGLFSEEAREQFAEQLGLDHLSKSTLQKSVTRLKQTGLIESLNRGWYEYSELAFKDYVLQQAKRAR